MKKTLKFKLTILSIMTRKKFKFFKSHILDKEIMQYKTIFFALKEQ